MKRKMMNILNKVAVFAFICLLLALSFISGYVAHTPKESVLELKYDTVYVNDTIIIEKPIERERIVLKDKYITDTVLVNNSPTIADIPLERVTYQDSNYLAILSGFQPKLDTLEIYQRGSLITKTVTVKENKSKLALSAQVGISLNNELKPYPYVGIGISYDLYRFNKK